MTSARCLSLVALAIFLMGFSQLARAAGCAALPDLWRLTHLSPDPFDTSRSPLEEEYKALVRLATSINHSTLEKRLTDAGRAQDFFDASFFVADALSYGLAGVTGGTSAARAFANGNAIEDRLRELRRTVQRICPEIEGITPEDEIATALDAPSPLAGQTASEAGWAAHRADRISAALRIASVYAALAAGCFAVIVVQVTIMILRAWRRERYTTQTPCILYAGMLRLEGALVMTGLYEANFRPNQSVGVAMADLIQKGLSCELAAGEIRIEARTTSRLSGAVSLAYMDERDAKGLRALLALSKLPPRRRLARSELGRGERASIRSFYASLKSG